MNHIMLDIETLDTKNSAVVLSVGGCVFNPTRKNANEQLGECIYLELNAYQQAAVGRTISLDTLYFWSKQNPGLEQFDTPRNLIEGDLTLLSAFMAHNSVTCAWSKGPSFDLCILRSLFSDFNLEFPIEFRKWYDVRTIELVRSVLQLPSIEFSGIEHHALSDAQYQTRLVCDTLYHIN